MRVAGSEASLPATPAPRTRISSKFYATLEKLAAMDHLGPMLSNNFLVVPQLGFPIVITKRSYWIPGVLGFNVVREGPCLFKPIENEGLQGGKRDNNEVGRPRPIYAPGIQQERFEIIDVRAQWVCHKAPWNRHRCKDGS
jgi:hypothetical protein